ncbi:Glutathione S transferase E7 [Carabus blaptoides fortunei]
MSKLILYGMDGSPPVRAVLAVAGALELELKRIDVNVMAGQQLKPDFVKHPVVILKKISSIPKEKINDALEAYAFLESFLTGHDWLAGDHLTIADFCASASVSTLDAIVSVDSETYPYTAAWLERCQGLPSYQNFTKLMKAGFWVFKKMIKR